METFQRKRVATGHKMTLTIWGCRNHVGHGQEDRLFVKLGLVSKFPQQCSRKPQCPSTMPPPLPAGLIAQLWFARQISQMRLRFGLHPAFIIQILHSPVAPLAARPIGFRQVAAAAATAVGWCCRNTKTKQMQANGASQPASRQVKAVEGAVCRIIHVIQLRTYTVLCAAPSSCVQCGHRSRQTHSVFYLFVVHWQAHKCVDVSPSVFESWKKSYRGTQFVCCVTSINGERA